MYKVYLAITKKKKESSFLNFPSKMFAPLFPFQANKTSKYAYMNRIIPLVHIQQKPSFSNTNSNGHFSSFFFSNNKKNKCTHYHMQFGILSNSFGCVIYVQSIRKWSEYQSIVIRINVFYFFVFITVLSHKHTFFAIVLASKRRRMCDIPSSQFDVKSFFNRHTHIYKKAIYVITTRRVL